MLGNDAHRRNYPKIPVMQWEGFLKISPPESAPVRFAGKLYQEKEKKMSIIAKEADKFPKLPLPEAGTVQAVCCAVWDLGLQKTTFKGTEKIQHKVVIAWELSQLIDAPESEYHGKPYQVSKRYTLSLGEMANLRHDLESWRGKPFASEDLSNGFDLEKLYGVNALIGIKHEPDKNDPSKVYANVTAILPLAKGMEKIVPVRARDEEPPKWIIEKQAQAIKEETIPEPPEEPPLDEENPF